MIHILRTHKTSLRFGRTIIYIRGGTGTAMGGSTFWNGISIADGDGQPLKRFQRIFKDIAVDRIPCGNCAFLLAVEFQVTGRTNINFASFLGIRNENRLDFYGNRAVDITHLKAQLAATNRNVYNLSDATSG